jgi:CheY-like chemotaxis protein
MRSTPAPSTSAGCAHSFTPVRRRVLVIDDSPLIREAAAIALERVAGFEVLAFESAELGIEAAQRACPDAILLDLVMPGLDGASAARQLAADPATRTIPVVLMTAAERESGAEPLAGIPARGVIAKPFAVATLGVQLRALLGWSP